MEDDDEAGALESYGGDVDNLVAVMSGADRRGYWRPASQINVYALMGGAHVDFREAGLLEGTTIVDAYALMGGVELIFPPDVEVESRGIGFMGGFSHTSNHADDPFAPLVIVRGFACMGGVEIKVREPFVGPDGEAE